jgi:hypothetical protein
VASRRHVLVVSTVELAGAAIEGLVGDDATTMVVVPAVRQSPLQWLANDEDRARRTAERASERLADETPGETITARAGDSDPLLAIKDALGEFPADEIVVVTRPQEEATWLEAPAVEGGAVQVHGVPVTRAEVREDGSVAERN